MSRSDEYSELFYSYAQKNRLDENIDDWPQKNQDEWEEIYQDFLNKSKSTESVDSFADDEFYIIRTIVDTETGSEEVVTDVRDLDLDELSQLCRLFPQYNKYYFSRVFNSQ